MTNLEDIKWLIVRLLAEDRGAEPSDLWEELCDLGADMPVDSLFAVEVVVRLEAQLGISLPTTGETARALRSVKALSGEVARLVAGDGVGSVASA